MLGGLNSDRELFVAYKIWYFVLLMIWMDAKAYKKLK